MKKEIEQDLNEYIATEYSLLPEDKKRTLISIFDKYMHINSINVMFNKKDFNNIKSLASSLWKDNSFPKKFRDENGSIEAHEAVQLCLIEATVVYLNGKDCLKKVPNFNYKKEGEK